MQSTLSRRPHSPGSYVSFLLANSAQELSQLIENYVSMGQFEAARSCISQLIALDEEQALKLVYNILELQPSMYVVLNVKLLCSCRKSPILSINNENLTIKVR